MNENKFLWSVIAGMAMIFAGAMYFVATSNREVLSPPLTDAQREDFRRLLNPPSLAENLHYFTDARTKICYVVGSHANFSPIECTPLVMAEILRTHNLTDQK